MGIGDFEYRKLPVVEGMIAIEVDERIVAPFFSVQQIRSAHWQQNRMVIVRQILPVFILIQDSAAVRPAKRQAVAIPVCDRPLGSFGDRMVITSNNFVTTISSSSIRPPALLYK